MASRPLLLDLFCGAGGCSVGYHRAGFEVVGVDLHPQPNYPFPFSQGDALDALSDLFIKSGNAGRNFDAIHASPPCQAYSLATLFHGKEHAASHPDLVAPVRELLEQTGLPYVIENVPRAPVRNDMTLCGEMFGLRVHRHRVFEIGGWEFAKPQHRKHLLKGAKHNCHIEDGHARQVAGNYANHADASDAMGIDWMSRAELKEAIPPAYTHYIGLQLQAHLLTTQRVAA